MPNELLRHLMLMVAEALLVATLLLVFFRFRRSLGFAPLHATLSVFYQLATLMAGAFYIQVSDDLMMSPASIVLFPATVFAILFVYIREDTAEAKRMIYGLLAANAVVGVLIYVVAQHLQGAVVFNPHGVPAEFFAHQPRMLAIGTVALLADVALVVYLYDFLGRFFSRLPFLRIYLTTGLVLCVDTLIFVSGGFTESPYYNSILASGIVGKLVVGLLYSTALALYLRFFEHHDEAAKTSGATRLMTYRERYEQLQAQSMRDPLTGLFHRGVFESIIGPQIARATRSGGALSLLMVDVDKFKQVNDMFGHREGDEVLRAVAGALQSVVRASDFACRFGGEEFAILLPDTDHRQALALAERIRSIVTTECRVRTAAGTVQPITVSIGLACAPFEATAPEVLIELADQRLYEAKRSGRDRTSATGSFAPLPPKLNVVGAPG